MAAEGSALQRLMSSKPMDFPTRWAPGQALIAVLAMMALMLVLDIALYAAVLAWRNPGTLGSDQAFEALSEIDKYAPAIVAGIIVQGLLIALAFVAARRGGERAGDVLLLAGPQTGLGGAARAVILFMLATYLLAGLVYLIAPYDPLEVVPFMVALITSPFWPVLLAMLVIGAPLFEELWFRGFLFTALARSRLGVAGAASVSSGLWALMHLGYPLQVLLLVFLIGLMLTWLVLRTASLWPAVFAHALYNGTSFLYFRWLVDAGGAA